MGKPQLYRWDFDRNPWDSRAGANTFSVGVYQWLPKASGRGLKKSNTIRVLGYIADSQAVYDKAEELCSRLDKEKARFGELPSWVQKQYSVPKPADFVAKRQSQGLSGAQARVIRNRAVKEHLLPEGFIQSHASTYVRRVEELVQVVHFQTFLWGGSFTVNLGLHYTFTPPHGQLRRVKWSSLDHLDCSLERRIGFFLPQKLDTWFEFGDDPDALRGRFIYCIEQSIRVLDEYTAKLNKMVSILANSPLPGRFTFIGPFLVRWPSLFFSSIEMRLWRLDDAARRLRVPFADGQVEKSYRPKHRKLLTLIQRMRKAKEEPERAAKLLEWVTD